MYGKLHQRKLREKDYEMSCEGAREQLQEYIDAQARRVNVDSAKKLAVMQHMDYEGFRQMVLGANIFPSKSGQLQTAALLDHSLPKNKLFNANFSPALSLTLAPSELSCACFRDFKVRFNERYRIPLNQQTAEMCYFLIQNQNQIQIPKIFAVNCEAVILVKIAHVFLFILAYLNERKQELQREAHFQRLFWQKVLKLETMQMPLSILSKKQKTVIDEALRAAQRITGEAYEKQIKQVQ